MTREITKQALEAAIVRNCSPMLAGLKPACLFTFPGVFLAQGEHVDKQELACSNRAKLLEELEPCAKRHLAARSHLEIVRGAGVRLPTGHA